MATRWGKSSKVAPGSNDTVDFTEVPAQWH